MLMNAESVITLLTVSDGVESPKLHPVVGARSEVMKCVGEGIWVVQFFFLLGTKLLPGA